jgi:predicted N-formylglutamate amidohydrolase
MVPQQYTHLFKAADEILTSHRGWDPGAIEIANYLSAKLSAPLFKCDTTRLLIEPNRSLHSDSLFSEYSQTLNSSEREEVLQQFYLPHRSSVERLIGMSGKKILHLSIHTFTPVWNGTVREVDIGLLFDPNRKNESIFCEAYSKEICERLPELRTMFNEPYKGTDDGFTTYLRTKFDDDNYLGIEIEVNQKYFGTRLWGEIAGVLAECLPKV